MFENGDVGIDGSQHCVLSCQALANFLSRSRCLDWESWEWHCWWWWWWWWWWVERLPSKTLCIYPDLSIQFHSSSFAAWLRRLFMFSLRKCLRLHLEGGCCDASVHVFLGLHWAAVVLGVHLATWIRTAEWKLACWVVFCEFSLAYQLPTRVLSISFYIYISLVPPALSPTVHFAVSETAHVTWSKQVNNDWIMWMWWSFYVCKFPEAYPQNLVDCLAR